MDTESTLACLLVLFIGAVALWAEKVWREGGNYRPIPRPHSWEEDCGE